jgi:GWxTD domain-containing protein
LSFYYEVYNDAGFSGDYLAIYSVSDGDRLILCDSTMFPSSGVVTPHLESLNVDTLLAEQYKLMIEIQSPGAKMKIKYGDQFVIGWSVAGTVKNDFKTAVEQLRYIANKEEMKKLNDAPVAERKKAWEEFWKSQDRTPSTADNEVREEYYKRLRYADINYGNFGRNGWKTDMGMVYITYGPPDEVERHPFDIDAKPYQVWYYYNTKRIFTFVDVNGYGEYQLIYPYDGDTRKIR